MKPWRRIQDITLFTWTLILNYLNIYFCLQSPYLKGVTIVHIARNDVQFANLHSYIWGSLQFSYILYLNVKTVISACIRFKTKKKPSWKSIKTCSYWIVDESIAFMYCMQLCVKCKWTMRSNLTRWETMHHICSILDMFSECQF